MSARLRRDTVLYALAALPLTVVQVPLYVYVPKFYSDVVGVSIGAIGTLMLVSRLFDALTDPIVGELSDITSTRWGRRSPWIGFASIPLAFALVAMFAPPAGAGFGWVAVTTIAIFAFWTAVYVPYEALGVEITSTYDERTTVIGLRDGLGLVGTLFGVVTPFAITWGLGLGDTPEDQRLKFAIFAVVYGSLMVLCCQIVAWGVKERPYPEIEDHGPLRERVMVMRKNRPFLTLLAAFAVGGLGANIPGATLLYYVEYVVGASWAELYLVLYVATGIAFVPLWVWAARRFEKRSAWICALSITATAQLGAMAVGPGDALEFALLTAFGGTSFGALFALPAAMQADVIDEGERLSGYREEGLYIGIWNIARKLAGAFGVGLALWILGTSGYQPNIEQGPEVLTALRMVYGGLPAAFTLLAIAILLLYPIDRARHAQIRAEIAARSAG